MGLDMNAFSTSEKVEEDFGFEIESEKRSELAYWRKHYKLHDWFEKLYKERGGNKSFNCISLKLTLEDLLRLRAEIISGIFVYDEDYYKVEDMKFLKLAIEEAEDGRTIYYDSWW